MQAESENRFGGAKSPSGFARNQESATPVMREKFYGLLREYLLAIRERDLLADQLRTAVENTVKEEAIRRMEAARKHCVALRQEIRRYPDVSTLSRARSPYNPPVRHKVQAS
jgi:hypothetical protein